MGGASGFSSKGLAVVLAAFDIAVTFASMRAPSPQAIIEHTGVKADWTRGGSSQCGGQYVVGVKTKSGIFDGHACNVPNHRYNRLQQIEWLITEGILWPRILHCSIIGSSFILVPACTVDEIAYSDLA